MQIESLESRRLLSASLNATAGLLTVTGTSHRDRITITRGELGKLIATETTYNSTTASAPATIVTTRTVFRPLQVKSILVDAEGGNDFVDVSGNHDRPIFFLPSTVNGGDGNDLIYGGQGKDSLDGGGGNDALYGLGSNDTLQGGNGSDKLVGGLGADQMFGGAGNDLIYARDGSGTDHVDGGTNLTPTALNPGDIAIVDKGDLVTAVEKLITP